MWQDWRGRVLDRAKLGWVIGLVVAPWLVVGTAGALVWAEDGGRR